MASVTAVLLLSLLCPGLLGEEADPALHKAGANVLLTWSLPDIDIGTIRTFTIAKDAFNQPLFYGSTSPSKGNITKVKQYEERMEVLGLYARTVSFILKNVTALDAGHYICFAGLSDVKLTDCGQMLVIIDQPVDVKVSANEAAVVGQNLQLECAANSASLPADHGLPLQVQWYDNLAEYYASEGLDKVQVSGHRLTVKSIQRSDEGLQFSCRAMDGLQMWSAVSEAYTLQPEYAPTESDIQLDPEHKQVRVVHGSTVQQRCYADCRPECSLTWQKNDMESSQYFTLQDNETLVLRGVQRDNDGEYRCLASNTYGSAFLPFHIVVLYTPTLQARFVNGVEQAALRVGEGETANMTCMFDSKPAPEVVWYNMEDGTKALLEDNLSKQTPLTFRTGQIPQSIYVSSYVIRNAECRHTSTYSCTARNHLGEGIGGQINLFVFCVPRSAEGKFRLKKLYMFHIDEPAKLEFMVVAYPNPKIEQVFSEDGSGRRRLLNLDQWTQSIIGTTSNPYLTKFIFKFQNPSLDIFDKTYYLKIANNEGFSSLAFKLMAKGPPKPPSNLTAVSVSDRTVLLRFTPGFHGGKPQSFSVEYQLVAYGSNGSWVTSDTNLQATQDSLPVEVFVEGLEPNSLYNFRVHAANEHGGNFSTVVVVTTAASAASSASAGPIAGIVIGVLVSILLICVFIYIFVIRRKRSTPTDTDGQTMEPMLTTLAQGSEDAASSKSKKNNNASEEIGEQQLEEKNCQASLGDKWRNQDGLIYADLDLSKPSQPVPVQRCHDSVNYEKIDFTQHPPFTPQKAELDSDEEEYRN